MTHKSNKVSSKKEKGRLAEQKALDFLEQKGFRLCERNYKVGRKEIDLIVQKNDLLVFVEVKSRKNTDFGYPEEGLSSAQQARIILAAQYYIFEKNWQKDIRFDIIAIVESEPPEITHLEDAFY